MCRILYLILVLKLSKYAHCFLPFTNGSRSWLRMADSGSPEVQVQGRQTKGFKGTVALVGAGPGDPLLLTVQALRLIESATLVVADRLVSQDILNLVKCELKIANKRPGCAEEAQREINKWVLDAVEAGGNVVRLKIGDPFLFGRAGEEVQTFRSYGVEPVVAAGLSSSYAAPLAANIPLTHRGVSNQIVVCTGYGRDSTSVELPHYRDFCTVVLLMSVGRIGRIASELVDKGYPASMPVAIVENATSPKQRVIKGCLRNIGEVAARHKAK